VDKSEESGGDPEVQDEVLVERWAVGGGVCGQGPACGKEYRRVWGDGHRLRILPRFGWGKAIVEVDEKVGMSKLLRAV
jgi:hypothetical protein